MNCRLLINEVRKTPENLKQIADLYLRLNEKEKSKSIIEDSLKVKPIPGAYLTKGIILQNEKKYDQAENNYRKAI